MLFVGITTYSFAQNTKPAIKEDASRDAVLSGFMKAQMTNDVASLRKLIARDAVILIPGKIDQVRISKDEYLDFLKQSGKMQQQCYPSYEILSSNANNVTARVDFDYTGFIIHHYLKAEKKNDNWKITELNKSFPSSPAPVIVMQ